MFINEDFPTLLLPIKANSGLSGGGQCLLLELLFKNLAFFISIFVFVFNRKERNQAAA
jgi:hypothetical protein